jgi:hypothetical protein
VLVFLVLGFAGNFLLVLLDDVRPISQLALQATLHLTQFDLHQPFIPLTFFQTPFGLHGCLSIVHEVFLVEVRLVLVLRVEVLLTDVFLEVVFLPLVLVLLVEVRLVLVLRVEVLLTDVFLVVV